MTNKENMDNTKKRNNILPFLVAGCFSVGFFELACFINTELSGGFLLDEIRDYELSIILLFMLLGLTILIFQQRCRLYSLIWVLSYFVGSREVWNMNDKKIFMVLSYVMAFLLLIIVVLDIANVKAWAFMVASSAIWFTVMIAQAFIMLYQMLNQEISTAVTIFYAAWFYMVLFSMTQTVPFMKIFSPTGMILGVSSPILMASHTFLQSNLIAEEPLTIFLYRIPSFIMAITMLLYVIWIRKSESEQHRIDLFSGAIAILTGVCIGFGYIAVYRQAYDNDIGVRKLNAKAAYRDQLDQDEYNWMEIAGKEEMVSVSDLKYRIVDLNDGSMPVMFLSGGMTYEASGDTRIVFYDEEKQKPYQVWGNHNCIGVAGYIPADKDHDYPLIFCKGGRQGLDCEFIYEVRNQKLYLIAEMYDVWPHEIDENDPGFTPKTDEYYWLGEEVSMIQYQNTRDAISNGYVDIAWNS